MVNIGIQLKKNVLSASRVQITAKIKRNVSVNKRLLISMVKSVLIAVQPSTSILP